MTTLTTTAGWAGFGENFFAGKSVPKELLGRHGLWSMIALAQGHPGLNAADERLLDDAVVAMNSSDPRIWPIKMSWLVGSYGSPVAAEAAGSLWREGAIVGSAPAEAAARTWRQLDEALGEDGRDDAIAAWFAERRDAGQRVPGFGVPAREQDERVLLLERVIRDHGRQGGRHVSLLAEVNAVLEGGSRLRPNVVGAMSALCLDLGFEPTAVPALVQVGLSLSLVANGVDAARQRSCLLRCLPVDAISFAGVAPRRSPRAEAKS